jgi:hypothetical protein
MEYEINDIRHSNEFKCISFSGYKKISVRDAFMDNMMRGKIEPACYWCAELICSGHFSEIWDTILLFVGKYVHLGNPKIIIYLEKRYSIFKEIINNGKYLCEMHTRNDNNLRKLFAEIVCVLSVSNRCHCFDVLKLDVLHDFDMIQIRDKLTAPSIEYCHPFFLKNDPIEFMVAINEFSYCISKVPADSVSACYWIEWIIQFDVVCKKKKEKCIAERRAYIPVEFKHQQDVIWIIWDALFHYGKLRGIFVEKILQSILQMFSVKYSSASTKKYKHLLYFAVGIVTEPTIIQIDLITDKDKPMIENVVEKINNIYSQIKKNECSPNTDYLFSSLNESKTNFEKSIKKMEMLKTMDNTILL